MEIAEIKISYSSNLEERIQIQESSNAYKAFLTSWDKDTIELNEEVKIMLLNRANEVLGIYPLAKGGVAGCFVDIKQILAVALKSNASSIILAHNHPSGKLLPSVADKKLTTKLKNACEQLDLMLLDHLIISKDGYYNFTSSEDF